MENNNDVKAVVATVAVSSVMVDVECPKCGYENNGWLDDPRGKETSCDDCGFTFQVSATARVVIR